MRPQRAETLFQPLERARVGGFAVEVGEVYRENRGARVLKCYAILNEADAGRTLGSHTYVEGTAASAVRSELQLMTVR